MNAHVGGSGILCHDRKAFAGQRTALGCRYCGRCLEDCRADDAVGGDSRLIQFETCNKAFRGIACEQAVQTATDVAIAECIAAAPRG